MNNAFFELKPAVGTKETGMVYPSVTSFDDYDFNSPNSVYNLDSDWFPDFVPDIRFKLAEGAKLCDLVAQSTISACGLLISQRLKAVLENETIVPHRFFPATIKVNESIHCYYWIHFVWNEGINYLDFKRSKFKIKRARKELGDIGIESLADLHTKQGELGFIKMIHNYEYTFLNPGFSLFVHPLNKTLFVSRALKVKIDSFSGIDFIPADSLKIS